MLHSWSSFNDARRRSHDNRTTGYLIIDGDGPGNDWRRAGYGPTVKAVVIISRLPKRTLGGQTSHARVGKLPNEACSCDFDCTALAGYIEAHERYNKRYPEAAKIVLLAARLNGVLKAGQPLTQGLPEMVFFCFECGLAKRTSRDQED